jgi:hypothetical protein
MYCNVNAKLWHCKTYQGRLGCDAVDGIGNCIVTKRSLAHHIGCAVARERHDYVVDAQLGRVQHIVVRATSSLAQIPVWQEWAMVLAVTT